MHADFGAYAKSTNSNSYVNIICHPKYVMGTSEVFLYNAKYNVMKKNNSQPIFFARLKLMSYLYLPVIINKFCPNIFLNFQKNGFGSPPI
jgi:hypothetical protein